MNSSGSNDDRFSRQLEAYEARKLVYEAIGSVWASETPKPKPKPRAAKRRAKPMANPTPKDQKKKKEPPQQIEDVESKDVELEDEDLNQQTEDECYEEIHALKVFGDEHFNMPEAEVIKAWEETSHEDKGRYLKLAKHVVEQMSKMERE